MNDLDRYQIEYDNQLPDEDNFCLRCEEQEAETGEDYCEYCNDLIKYNNRNMFQSKETY